MCIRDRVSTQSTGVHFKGMGNTVGSDERPLLFNDLGKSDGKAPPAKFPANLKAWKLSSDAHRRCVTTMDPLDWAQIDSFDPKCCYLLLLSYAVAETKAQLAGNVSTLEAGILALAQSASGSLTPRGLSNPFSSGEDNPSFVFMNTAHKSHSFGVFLWNGLQADPVVKATALTKAFALERQLIEQQDCLQQAHNADATSLHTALLNRPSAVQRASSSPDASALANTNELFHWLLQGPRRSFERHQDGPWPHVAQALAQPPPIPAPELEEPTAIKPTLNIKTSTSSSPATKPKLTLPGLSLHNLGAGRTTTQSSPAKGMQSESAIRQGELDKYNHVCSQVLPYLFVGARKVAEDKELLQQCGITHIVNCAGMVMENCHPESFKYLKLHLFDAKTEDLSCLFYEVLAFVDAAKESGGKCFIHCHQGVSRSCTCVIAYIMSRLKLTYEESFAKTQEARPICNPNTGFICQLLDFSRRLTEPMAQPRAYRVVEHAPHVPDCNNICARLVASEGNNLSHDECVVIHTPTRVFLWIGTAAKDECVAAAKVHVQRLQLFESAPRSCDMVTDGAESSAFWNAASLCGFETPVAKPQATVLPSGAPEPKGFELLKLNMPQDANPEPASVRGPREPDATPQKKKPVENEPAMYGFPDWDEIEMFDMDDLMPDQAFIVVPAGRPPACVHVWMGQEFLEDFGYAKGPEMAGEFLALQSMPPETEVKIEVEDEESDLFWERFVNG
eukprot:TRINITY_DN9276_c0_g1_i1.p1 TRINITY_DN9276_c0_g1~~TRINITY_DN9276_c0_g1_i1.p1  ORF type:complete len:732 (+),score=142.29 TRINITY_DN9276_c0_g1_i1:106-2301(+)